MPELLKARLTQRVIRTPTIESFRFIPQKKIDFIPGQFLQVIFDEANPGNKELNKYLSFSSLPGRQYLEVTKRLTNSAFSQKLRGLKAGDAVLFKAPLGNCVFDSQYQKIGFLIGGIGITPVISIIGQIMERKINTDVVLFYSNRNEEEIAFKKELDYWQDTGNNLRIVYTVSETPPQDKGCVFGTINKDLILNNTADFKQRVFFIFGPPKMVEAMAGLCLELGIAADNIKTEGFIGY